MMRSGPNRGSALHFEAGSSTLARPFFPCQNCAVMSFWFSGCCAPRATTTSQRPASETIFSAFSNPCSRIHVAGHYCERFHFELRRIQSQNDGHGIVGAWIGVNDHPPRRDLRKSIRLKNKNEERNKNERSPEGCFTGKVLSRGVTTAACPRWMPTSGLPSYRPASREFRAAPVRSSCSARAPRCRRSGFRWS